MKTCFKCKRELTPSEFYLHPMMADGRLGKCKDCAKRDVTENRRARAEQYREYDARRDRVKVNARVRVRNRVKRGVMERGKCERCGTPNAQAHHEDYSRPLDIRWLCAACHGREHRIKGWRGTFWEN